MDKSTVVALIVAFIGAIGAIIAAFIQRGVRAHRANTPPVGWENPPPPLVTPPAFEMSHDAGIVDDGQIGLRPAEPTQATSVPVASEDSAGQDGAARPESPLPEPPRDTRYDGLSDSDRLAQFLAEAALEATEDDRLTVREHPREDGR
ncbi:hypothetical protein AB0H28_26500 [Micromonospora sp. NPDC050980]|uniref:hypothetical protein n=1 Tax=Micromonospora sp. NPDC050980 TaxID=3155161 RepID=UPI0033D8F02D